MSVTQFVIPLWTDLSAVAIGSTAGAICAASPDDDGIDLLGVGLVGTATGLGGAFLRDTLLNVNPAVLNNNWYLPTAAGAALLGVALWRVMSRLSLVWALLDALTVGLYGAIGTTKSIGLGLPLLPAMFVGTAAAVGGAAVRDVLLGLPVGLLRVGSLYAVAAGAGIVALVVCLELGLAPPAAAGICVVATTLVRVGSVKYGWSLPPQHKWTRGRT